MNIGKELKMLRVLSDKKSQDIAKEVGISASYYSLIENGHRIPTDDVMESIASIFGKKYEVTRKLV